METPKRRATEVITFLERVTLKTFEEKLEVRSNRAIEVFSLGGVCNEQYPIVRLTSLSENWKIRALRSR